MVLEIIRKANNNMILSCYCFCISLQIKCDTWCWCYLWLFRLEHWKTAKSLLVHSVSQQQFTSHSFRLKSHAHAFLYIIFVEKCAYFVWGHCQTLSAQDNKSSEMPTQNTGWICQDLLSLWTSFVAFCGYFALYFKQI